MGMDGKAEERQLIAEIAERGIGLGVDPSPDREGVVLDVVSG